MAKYTKTQEKKEEKVFEYDIEVFKPKIVGEGRVKFDMLVNGVYLYGLNLIEGQKGPFVSFPQWKSDSITNEDGSPKYFKYCYFKITDEMTKDIIVPQIDKLLQDN